MARIKIEIKRLESTTYAFGSNLNYTFAIWIVSVIINYFLGAGELGKFSMIQAIISPLALFFQLQLKVLATIEFNLKGKFSVYQKTILTSEFALILVISLIGLLTKQPGLFYAFGIFKVIEVYYNFIQGYYQSHNNFKYVFYNSTIRGVIIVLFVILSLKLFKSTSLGFLGTSLILLPMIFFFDLKNISKEVPSILPGGSNEEAARLFLNGASISLVAFMDSLMVSIPRYFIKIEYNDVELGRFTMVLQFFIAATIFVVSVGHPFLVRLKTNLLNNDKRRFNNEIKLTLLIFLAASGLIIIFFIVYSDFIMKIVWGRENVILSNDLKLSLIGIVPLFLSSIFIYVINSLKYFKVHILYYPFVVIAEIIFGFYIIPLYGLRGGVLTIVFTQMIRMILSGMVFLVVLHRFKNGTDQAVIDHITPAE